MKRLVQASLLACRLAAIVLCFWPLQLGAQSTFRLAWDEASIGVTGYAVTVDGARVDYGLTPVAGDGTCNCSIPLPFSGGNHTVVVIAYDAIGETPSSPLIVGPVASPGGAYTAQVGSALSVDGSASSHPAGSIVQWTWNWGDSSANTTAPIGTATHVYGAAGTFTITLTVTDNAGARASATTTATITATPPPPPPPPPPVWRSQDIGQTVLPGGASFAGGVFTVSGSGADIWGTADAFQYVYQPVSGDSQITARVTTILNTDTFAKAGVMLRESTSAGSAHVILDVRPDGSVELMTRSGTNGDTAYISGTTQVPPTWLKLVRTGSTVTGFASGDGLAWTNVGTTSVTMSANALMGLVVTSHDITQINISTFDQVVVSSGTVGGLPSPWQNQDVGSTGQAGSASFANGAFTVNGSGADIWDTTDGFQYVYQAHAGDGQIVARVTALQNTDMFAKAGVMLRETTDAGAVHVILDVRPDGSVEFMTRQTTGGTTSYVSGAVQTPPTWLKLVRAGSTVTGYVSQNGSSWTTVGSTNVGMSSTALIGLVVTSHNNGQMNTSTFDNVAVQ
jgi:PKD repeat protein